MRKSKQAIAKAARKGLQDKQENKLVSRDKDKCDEINEKKKVNVQRQKRG